MKTRKLTLLSLTILATLLLGAFAINVILAPAELKLKVKWKPVEYTLNTPPDPWWAELSIVRVNPDDIVASTILLEGIYSPRPTPPPYITTSGRLAVPFYGDDVVDALLPKAPHLSPGEYRINLEITGQLDDGTPFRGSGGITILVPENSPP